MQAGVRMYFAPGNVTFHWKLTSASFIFLVEENEAANGHLQTSSLWSKPLRMLFFRILRTRALFMGTAWVRSSVLSWRGCFVVAM
jgi:hypothetical protein